MDEPGERRTTVPDPGSHPDRGADTDWWDPEATPAATVVVLRDRDDLEVLVLRRDTSLGFAGGAWVFPGGRIDPGDHAGEGTGDHAGEGTGDHAGEGTGDGATLETAARRAAVREAHEEAGLHLRPADLVRWSHWTPPARAGRRFTTAFFCTRTDGRDAVVVDDGEIREHRWARPGDLIADRDAGALSLTPPTYITLAQLAAHHSAEAAVEHARTHRPEHFATRVAVDGDEWIALYHGDVAYAAAAVDPPPPEVLHADGPRHRLTMGSTWHYRRSGSTPG